jgi:hypothetical protein
MSFLSFLGPKFDDGVGDRLNKENILSRAYIAFKPCSVSSTMDTSSEIRMVGMLSCSQKEIPCAEDEFL